MAYVLGLRCRECGADYPHEPLHVCDQCFGPLEVVYDLARTESIFAEPAGGTTVAVTRKLIEQGRIARDESIVISVTGNGYKTLEAVRESVAAPSVINARLQDFDHLYDSLAPQARRAAGRE